MDRETLVYVDLDGKPHLVGRLWAHVSKNKESASFEYDKTWLENPVCFSLEPALQVGLGAFHTPADTPMFGAIGEFRGGSMGAGTHAQSRAQACRTCRQRAALAAGNRLPFISG